VALLHRLGQAELREALSLIGNGRWPGWNLRRGGCSEAERGSKWQREYVWEVERSGVSLKEGSGAPFKGRRGGMEGWARRQYAMRAGQRE
jgi:hypothetical protein